MEHNRYWNRYEWPQGGDEWTDQAAFCGIPYQTWKLDIAQSFIWDNVAEDSTVLEIATGHGRWTPMLSQFAKRYIGVDMNENCVSFCQKQFSQLENVKFCTNDGQSLPMIDSKSINFIWSFDSFVHIERDITQKYLEEFFRVLAPGGNCCIHHPGSPSDLQRSNGWRSSMNMHLFRSMSEIHGLQILSQVDSWGPDERSNTKLFGDCISMLKKPL